MTKPPTTEPEDKRKPHEIAQAILDHTYFHSLDEDRDVLFAEILAIQGEEHARETSPSGALIPRDKWGKILGKIAAQESLDAQEKYEFSEEIFPDIEKLRKTEIIMQQLNQVLANPDRKARSSIEKISQDLIEIADLLNVQYVPPEAREDQQRAAADDIATSGEKLMNLKRIEKEIRALARSMGMQLTEPELGK